MRPFSLTAKLTHVKDADTLAIDRLILSFETSFSIAGHISCSALAMGQAPSFIASCCKVKELSFLALNSGSLAFYCLSCEKICSDDVRNLENLGYPYFNSFTALCEPILDSFEAILVAEELTRRFILFTETLGEIFWPQQEDQLISLNQIAYMVDPKMCSDEELLKLDEAVEALSGVLFS